MAGNNPHPETHSMLAARRGEGPPGVPVWLGLRGSANQAEAEVAINLWRCAWALKRNPSIIDEVHAERFCDLFTTRLAEEARIGWLFGESPGTYGNKWALMRLHELAALQEIRRLHPSPAVLAAWGALVLWWQGTDTILRQLVFPNGDSGITGSRHKHAGIQENNLLLPTIYGYRQQLNRKWDDYIIGRMREPLSSEWWQLRGHERLLVEALWGDDGRLLLSILGPQVWPRLAHPTWLLAGPDGLRWIICSAVLAKGDGEGKTAIGWEVRWTGSGVESVWERDLRRIKSDTMVPHPTRSLSEIRGIVSAPGWRYLGPDSPIPEPGEGPAEPGKPAEPLPPVEPEPEPEPTKPADSDQPTPEEIERARGIIKEVQKTLRKGSAGRRRLHDALVALRDK